ncbi:hypothetical protein ID866_11382 [Astraeus odoratus]|nr:hypothetical protein ID866_11382 [Astraeus odoratus]
MTLPNMAKVGQDAITASHGQIKSPSGTEWMSLYSAMDITINQTTPLHRDCSSAPSFMDLAVSLGSHNAHFNILDLSAKFAYLPGTMIFLAGKLLQHEVPKWDKEERITLVHYMKVVVHNRLHAEGPPFMRQCHIHATQAWTPCACAHPGQNFPVLVCLLLA